MRKLLSTVSLAVTCALSGTASAEIITYDFTAIVYGGAVLYADGSDDPTLALMGDARVVFGNTVTGRLSYDTDMPKWFSPRPNYQLYLGGNGALSFQVGGSGFTFRSSAADRPQASVSIDGGLYRDGSDHFSFGSHTYDEDNVPPYTAGLLFNDDTGTAFDSTALPSTLDLRKFSQATLDALYHGPGYFSQFYAQLTSLERVSAVPEPSSAAMVLAGLGLLGGSHLLRRRR